MCVILLDLKLLKGKLKGKIRVQEVNQLWSLTFLCHTAWSFMKDLLLFLLLLLLLLSLMCRVTLRTAFPKFKPTMVQTTAASRTWSTVGISSRSAQWRTVTFHSFQSYSNNHIVNNIFSLFRKWPDKCWGVQAVQQQVDLSWVRYCKLHLILGGEWILLAPSVTWNNT